MPKIVKADMRQLRIAQNLPEQRSEGVGYPRLARALKEQRFRRWAPHAIAQEPFGLFHAVQAQTLGNETGEAYRSP